MKPITAAVFAWWVGLGLYLGICVAVDIRNIITSLATAAIARAAPVALPSITLQLPPLHADPEIRRDAEFWI